MAFPFDIGFTAPWLLLALLGLPILWILLRAVPPAPIRRLFPGVILLLGLRDDDNQSDKTPWWLLLLRSLAVAGIIIGFAGPVLNPDAPQTEQGPVLILLDGSWADARGWQVLMDRVTVALEDAERRGQPVAIVELSAGPAGESAFLSADAWLRRLTGIQPTPWEPDDGLSIQWAAGLEGKFATLWLSDGLDRASRGPVLKALQTHGPVRIFENPAAVYGLRPPVFDGNTVTLEIIRSRNTGPAMLELRVKALDPTGVERVVEQVVARFEPGQMQTETKLNLQPELRNRLTRFDIASQPTAGSTHLSGDDQKRRKVAVVHGGAEQEGLRLLSPTHYLEQALRPGSELIQGTIEDVILSSPTSMILSDVAGLAPSDAEKVESWVKDGGLLVRFAGPRLAGSDLSRGSEDPLMPVRLRVGGRTVGGTMSWGDPKSLQAFDPGSPFYGLTIPDDVVVNAQVIAEPDPNLSDRVIASLSDGTPLVTRKALGAGQVILFHVTANAEWSSLPLSGLFVEMLERLAVSGPVDPTALRNLVGTTWVADRVLDGFGTLQDAQNLGGVPGEAIAKGAVSADLPPGLYTTPEQSLALNVISSDRVLTPADWPADVVVEGLDAQRETPLKAWFLMLSLALLSVDVLAALWVGGRLRRATGAASVALLGLVFLQPGPARAQDDLAAIEATTQVVLAHVLTGNRDVDRVAQAGLRGLSDTLFRRTSVEPADPVSVDIEQDELAFFPFLYWPITPEQPQPSDQAIARLNRYLQTGGMILFDTRDADVASYGVASPNGRKLRQIAAQLDIPALEPVPADHVLTRTFYLLDVFPGRYLGRDVWLEASPAGAELAEGMPFRNLNDNVTPVVIGGNDWAAAWAVDNLGSWMFPIGRGQTGERQREIANRFGVNLIMYVLTGNYKSDQVHVPALLDRLGQ